MSGVRFQRGNFVVANIEKSLEFYRDILGFEVAFMKESKSDSYSYPVFEIPSDRKMRFAVLSTETQPRVMALTEVEGPIEPAPHPRRSAIVLEMPDLDTVLEKSRASGLHVYPEEHLVTQDGREGREVGIVDRDDNLVVLYWITKLPD
jgi:catechol 2,3-dioxygenase-like lactoylglutathione lyase family enzyme